LSGGVVSVQGTGVLLGTLHRSGFTCEPLGIDLNMGAAVKNLIFVVDFRGAARQTGIATIAYRVINALPFSRQVFTVTRVIQDGAKATATRKRLVFAFHAVDLLNH